MRCVLVSCCGLPAAGKTTFCRRVVASDPVIMPAKAWASNAAPETPDAQTKTLGINEERETRVRVSHTCFDEYIRRAGRRRRPSSGENNSPSETSTAPDPPLDAGGESVEASRAIDMAPGAGLATVSEDGARLWHEGRQAALAEVEAFASTQDTTVLASAVEASHSSAERKEGPLSSETGSAVHVVLVDDNMHFRSMRHEVFSLARRYGCGYAQVYFPTAVELAVERNATRGTPVAETVIRKMAANIQPPDPKRFKWERHTAVVGAGDWPSRNPSGCRGIALEAGDGARGKLSVWDNSGVRQSFWRVIAAAAAAEDMMAPSSPASAAASLLQQEADREATRDSLLHQLDLELRESVKRVAKRAADAKLSSEVLHEVMQACSISRKSAMLRAKVAGNQSRAREADRSDASSLVPVRNKEGGGGAVGGMPPVFRPRLPHIEYFFLEFEKAVGNVEEMEAPVRQCLVAAARART